MTYNIVCPDCHQPLEDVTVVRTSNGYSITGLCRLIGCGNFKNPGGTIVDAVINPSTDYKQSLIRWLKGEKKHCVSCDNNPHIFDDPCYQEYNQAIDTVIKHIQES